MCAAWKPSKPSGPDEHAALPAGGNPGCTDRPGLFAITSRAGLGSLAAITLAGGIRTLNGVPRARISFRVRFHRGLLRNTPTLQLRCLAVALGAGALLERDGYEPAMVAMVLWAGARFQLSGRR